MKRSLWDIFLVFSLCLCSRGTLVFFLFAENYDEWWMKSVTRVWITREIMSLQKLMKRKERRRGVWIRGVEGSVVFLELYICNAWNSRRTLTLWGFQGKMSTWEGFQGVRATMRHDWRLEKGWCSTLHVLNTQFCVHERNGGGGSEVG